MGTTDDLTGRTIAFLATDGVEQVELTGPWDALSARGASLHLISNTDEVQGFEHLDKGETFPVDRRLGRVETGPYDALVLPGGVANGDALRTDSDAVALVRGFAREGKAIAAICHAPWVLIEADAVAGRQLTSWPSLRTDLRNAGAEWVDREVVVDQGDEEPGCLITSRKPDDIEAFVHALVGELAKPPATASDPA